MKGSTLKKTVPPSPEGGFAGKPQAYKAGILKCVSWKLCKPFPIWARLFWHFVRAAASRTFCTAGSSRPMRIAMMAITTNSSISVKPRRAHDERTMSVLLPNGDEWMYPDSARERSRDVERIGRGSPKREGFG